MGGNKNIHNHKNANTNGFDKNPQNINKKGQPVSIRAQLKDLLEADGNVRIPARQVIKVHDDGSVTLKLPTQMQLAMQLSSWAMSKKGTDSLKAIQMIMETIDGKPDQSVDHTTGGEKLINKMEVIFKDFSEDAE